MDKEKIDKDLLAALIYERSNCWDCGMEAAIKVLKRTQKDSKAAFLARSILKTAGEQYLQRHVMDKAMACYEAMVGFCPVAEKEPKAQNGEAFDIQAITELKSHTISLSAEVNQDIYEVFLALKEVKGNEEKDEAELLREGVYQLILKYATDKIIRELLISKLGAIL